MANPAPHGNLVILPSSDDASQLSTVRLATRRIRRLKTLSKKLRTAKKIVNDPRGSSGTDGVIANPVLPHTRNTSGVVANFIHNRRGSDKSAGKTRWSNVVVPTVVKPTASKWLRQKHNVRPGFEPGKKFKDAVRRVKLLVTVAAGRSRNKTFTQYLDMSGANKETRFRDLTFDPLWFASPRESRINTEAATALALEPEERTAQQRQIALVSLRTTVKEFSEYPLGMQQSLVTVGVYQSYERNRVIIRQGHFARNFYMILSGVVAVMVFRTGTDDDSGVGTFVAFLGKGSSFGEVAIMQNSRRTATVVCKDDVELLALERDDFVNIFMRQESGIAPEFIRFLHTVEELCGWPVHRLPWDDPSTCLLTYFRRGFVICNDTTDSDWIYVVKTGSCRLLKKLLAPTTDLSVLTGARTYDDVAQIKNKPLTSARRQIRSRMMPRPKNANPMSSSSPLKLPTLSTPLQAPPSGLDITQHEKALGKAFLRLVSQQGHGCVSAAMNSGTPAQWKTKEQKHVFIQLQTLGPKSVIGLEQVAFTDQGMGFSLVSEGTETVLINKAFLLGHLSGGVLKSIRSTIRPYPSESSLLRQLQESANWKAFKMQLVNDYASRTRRSLRAAAVLRC